MRPNIGHRISRSLFGEGTPSKKALISVLVIVVVIPLFVLPTNSLLNQELVEIRIDVENFGRAVNNQQIFFDLQIYARTQIETKVGVPVKQPLLEIRMALGLTDVFITTNTTIYDIADLDTRINPDFSLYNPQEVHILSLNPDNGFENIPIFKLRLNIQGPNLNSIEFSGALELQIKNLLMVPLIGDFIVEDMGFLYITRIFQANPPNEPSSDTYINQDIPISAAHLYLRVLIAILIIYLLFGSYRIKTWEGSDSKMEADHNSMYPSN